MPALTFTDADANVLDLNDGADFGFLDYDHFGIPTPRHDTVRTPSRHGETYVRTILEPRFLTLKVNVFGTGYGDLQVQRRTLATAFNPLLGVGTLKWTPDATLYAIDCILASEIRYNRRGPRKEIATISLRCPNPTWYDPTQNTDDIGNSGSGLSFPISFPISFLDGMGTTVFTNAGDVDSYPEITVPGACTEPVITNTTTGKKLQFVGLTIAGDETLIIDCDARTAEVDGISVIDKLSSDSEFWPLEPGNNTVTFAISSGDVTATLKHYTRFLGV